MVLDDISSHIVQHESDSPELIKTLKKQGEINSKKSSPSLFNRRSFSTAGSQVQMSNQNSPSRLIYSSNSPPQVYDKIAKTEIHTASKFKARSNSSSSTSAEETFGNEPMKIELPKATSIQQFSHFQEHQTQQEFIVELPRPFLSTPKNQGILQIGKINKLSSSETQRSVVKEFSTQENILEHSTSLDVSPISPSINHQQYDMQQLTDGLIKLYNPAQNSYVYKTDIIEAIRESKFIEYPPLTSNKQIKNEDNNPSTQRVPDEDSFAITCRVCKQTGVKSHENTPNEKQIVNPCRCKGTLHWAHKACVITEINDNLEKFEKTRLICCVGCSTPLKIEISSSISLNKAREVIPCIAIFIAVMVGLIYLLLVFIIKIVSQHSNFESDFNNVYEILLFLFLAGIFSIIILKLMRTEEVRVKKFSRTMTREDHTKNQLVLNYLLRSRDYNSIKSITI